MVPGFERFDEGNTDKVENLLSLQKLSFQSCSKSVIKMRRDGTRNSTEIDVLDYRQLYRYCRSEASIVTWCASDQRSIGPLPKG